jgi:hypothetical protein
MTTLWRALINITVEGDENRKVLLNGGMISFRW